MHTAALLAIICLGLVASVSHVDAGARQPSPEDLGYYDDDDDGSFVDSIIGIICVIIILGIFWYILGAIMGW